MTKISPIEKPISRASTMEYAKMNGMNREVSRIDPVGPEFMAPPARSLAADQFMPAVA